MKSDKLIKEYYRVYKDYVNTDRATASVYDGLKPVQRRLLYGLHEIGRDKFIKSATLVGHTMGRYHPHGDCLRGDTKFIDKNFKMHEIKDLCYKNKSIETFALVVSDHSLDITAMNTHSFRIGQYTDLLYRVILDSNEVVECTGNHPFLTSDFSWKKAHELTKDDELLYIQIDTKTGTVIFDTKPILRIRVQQLERLEPMYDFTQPVSENALIVLSKNDDGIINTIVAHNSSLYGSLVSLVNNGFVTGKGNFGLSFGLRNEPPAAMRYTEVKAEPLIEKIALEFLDQVQFVDSEIPGYKEPKYLPTMFPLSLIGLTKNPSYDLGIGVGLRSLYPRIPLKELSKLALTILDGKSPRKVKSYFGDIFVDIPLNKPRFDITYTSTFEIESPRKVTITSLAPNISGRIKKLAKYAFIKDESTVNTNIILTFDRKNEIGKTITKEELEEYLSTNILFDLHVSKDDEVVERITLLNWIKFTVNNYLNLYKENLIQKQKAIEEKIRLLNLVVKHMDIIKQYIEGKKRTLPKELEFIKQKTTSWVHNVNLSKSKKELETELRLVKRSISDIHNVVYKEYQNIYKIS